MSQRFQSPSQAQVLSFNKIPPHNLDAEIAVLASVMMDNESLNYCIEFITADDFYKESHKLIFRAMTDLADKNEPVDIITLSTVLEKTTQIEKVGGAAYLSYLTDSVPVVANVSSYAKLVREKSILRKLIQVGSDIVNDCYDTENDMSETLDRAEHRVFAVSEQKSTRSFEPVRNLVKSSYKLIEELFERKSDITGLPTGYKDLDKMTAGLQKGDLIIVAGRPSMGKTAFCLNIAENAARLSNAKVAVFSLEMSKESLVMRMLTSLARIDSMRVRTGDLKEEDWPRLLAAADELAHMNIFIDDQPAQTTMEIRAKTRRLAREQGGIDLIIVDYLQLMRGVTNTQNREQEISEISRSLKAIAKELRVPVMALSQLNRSLENRTNKRPMMSDLRESGAIEQDADVIAFIYRDEVYQPDTPEKGVAEIIIGKQRNGSTGHLKLSFLNSFVRFESLEYHPDYNFDAQPQGNDPRDSADMGDVIF